MANRQLNCQLSMNGHHHCKLNGPSSIEWPIVNWKTTVNWIAYCKSKWPTNHRLGTILKRIFSAQSGASIRTKAWKWSGETRFPGALLLLQKTFALRFLPGLLRFAPTNCPWVSEDGIFTPVPLLFMKIETCKMCLLFTLLLFILIFLNSKNSWQDLAASFNESTNGLASEVAVLSHLIIQPCLVRTGSYQIR